MKILVKLWAILTICITPKIRNIVMSTHTVWDIFDVWRSLRLKVWPQLQHTARRCAKAVYAMAQGLSVCLSVCHKPGVLSKLLNWSRWFSEQRQPSGILQCVKMQFACLELCPKLWTWPIFLLFFATPRRSSQLASVVTLAWPTTVASLSQRASTLVYNTIGATERVARFRLRQLRLVSSCNCDYDLIVAIQYNTRICNAHAGPNLSLGEGEVILWPFEGLRKVATMTMAWILFIEVVITPYQMTLWRLIYW